MVLREQVFYSIIYLVFVDTLGVQEIQFLESRHLVKVDNLNSSKVERGEKS